MEYKCQVQALLTPEEVRVQCLTPTHFPMKIGSHGDEDKEVSTDTQDESWNVYVLLTNGALFGCDLVVSATGVTPNRGGIEVEGARLDLADDGGVKVDKEMRTNLAGVYAAGDVCSVQWDDHSPVWFQVHTTGREVWPNHGQN